jgi:GH15 family glucan-1,4-alpha-glucosidase
MRDDDYLAIADHAIIGNLQSAALVGRDGEVSWCCLPNLDAPSMFASLLDRRRGGGFSLRPAGGRRCGHQRYLPGTNVLETTLPAERGELIITDWMPVAGSLKFPVAEPPLPVLMRWIRAQGGPMDVDLAWSPRLDYAQATMTMHITDDRVVASGGDASVVLCGLGDLDERWIEDDGVGPVARARVRLDPAHPRLLWTAFSDVNGVPSDAEACLAATCAAWRNWTAPDESRSWAGADAALIERSELTLKLLSHGTTGAMAAAATTSLPEEVGGVRNWDYRYGWIRDAALTAQALHALGHDAEAHGFLEWAERSAADATRDHLGIMYRLDGGDDLDEFDLPNLEGWRRSSPVRVGNGAAGQRQLDVLGDLVSLAWEMERLGDTLSDDIRTFLPTLADEACADWQMADEGLWELRNGPFNITYSKVMCWVALDRACRLARRGVIEGDVHKWSKSADAIRADVMACGVDDRLGFTQSYERQVPDAANLLIGIQEFVPHDHPAMRATVDTVIRELADGALVHRYRADDGIAGGEGSFTLCGFWLVDALALAGRVDEAEERFETLIGHANHVGLFAEQLDATTGEHLGNFPQAFTHLGLVTSRLYLAQQRGVDVPGAPLVGTT